MFRPIVTIIRFFSFESIKIILYKSLDGVLTRSRHQSPGWSIVYVCMYVCVCMCVCVCIYIYIERERERDTMLHIYIYIYRERERERYYAPTRVFDVEISSSTRRHAICIE